MLGPAVASADFSTLKCLAINRYMKRYIVEKVSQGQYKIVDTSLKQAIAWIAKKAPADRACAEINKNYEANLTKSS